MKRALFPGQHTPADSFLAPGSGRGRGGIADALHLLAGSLELNLHADLSKRAIEHASRAYPGETEEDALDRLGHAGRAVGLDIHLGCSLNDLLALDGPPAVSCVLDPGSDQIRWFAVHRQLGRLHIGFLGQPMQAVSENGLARWLDAHRHNAPWVVAELATPLATLGLPDDQPTPRPLTRLLALLRTERRDVIAIIAFAIAMGVLNLATPVAVQVLINTVAFGSLLQPIVVLSLLLFGILAFAATLRAMQAWLVEILQRRIFVRVVADLAHRLPRVRRDAFDATSGPGLVNRFFDVITVQKAASSLLVDGLSAALQALVGLVLLSFYHPILLGFDVLLLVVITFLIFGLGRGAQHTAIVESKKKYAVAEWLEELAGQTIAFKHHGGEELAVRKADALARAYLDARASHFRVVIRQFVGTLGLQVAASALLLGLGGWLVIEGQLTLGQLVASELIVTAALAALAKFSGKLDELYDLLAAMDKLGQLVDLPLERRQGLSPSMPRRSPAALQVRRLEFAHPDTGDVLRSLDLDVAPGDRVAILGSSGSGKSTLAELFFALREPRAGNVLFDDLELRELRPEALRGEVALASEGEIFSATLLENLTLGRMDLSAEAARAALHSVGLREAVEGLTKGLLTPLAASGAPLSRNQAARVILARAILQKPRLLIVDQLLDTLALEERERCLQALTDPDAPWSLVLMTSNPELAERAELSAVYRLDS